MTVLAAQRCNADRPGPWLVWLHGLWGNKEEWLLAAEAAGHYPSLLIDLPGHGGSQSIRAKTFPHVTQLITDTLAAHQIQDYWLIGYSLGGRLAMYHAAYGDPAGLRGLIIEARNPDLPHWTSAMPGCCTITGRHNSYVNARWRRSCMTGIVRAFLLISMRFSGSSGWNSICIIMLLRLRICCRTPLSGTSRNWRKNCTL